MKAQHKTQAHKRTLLVLTGTLALSFGAFASTAAASNTTRACIFDSSSCGQPEGTVVRGATIAGELTRVSTSGVLSPRGALALVDATGHVVNAKGSRVGGRTSGS